MRSNIPMPISDILLSQHLRRMPVRTTTRSDGPPMWLVWAIMGAAIVWVAWIVGNL